MTYTPEELDRMKNNLSISDDEVDKENYQKELDDRRSRLIELEQQLKDNEEKYRINSAEKDGKIAQLEANLDDTEDRARKLQRSLAAVKEEYERAINDKACEIIELKDALEKNNAVYESKLKADSKK
jgi:predicted  nucleic acid-binding Zn-ribbon protein